MDEQTETGPETESDRPRLWRDVVRLRAEEVANRLAEYMRTGLQLDARVVYDDGMTVVRVPDGPNVSTYRDAALVWLSGYRTAYVSIATRLAGAASDLAVQILEQPDPAAGNR